MHYRESPYTHAPFLHIAERVGAESLRGEMGGVDSCSILGAEVSAEERAKAMMME